MRIFGELAHAGVVAVVAGVWKCLESESWMLIGSFDGDVIHRNHLCWLEIPHFQFIILLQRLEVYISCSVIVARQLPWWRHT
jgi:hypothetical protein